MNHDTALDPLLLMDTGTDLGESSWISIDQAEINRFGEATRDIDPVHMDPTWALENSPYDGTILYGFQTLSLLTGMLKEVVAPYTSPSTGHFLNYGFDHVRLIAPVCVGSRIRGCFVLKAVREDAGGRSIVTFGSTVEIDGASKPALVADWLSVWVPVNSRLHSH